MSREHGSLGCAPFAARVRAAPRAPGLLGNRATPIRWSSAQPLACFSGAKFKTARSCPSSSIPPNSIVRRLHRLSRAASRAGPVGWEIARPGQREGGQGRCWRRPQVVEVGEAFARAGEARLDIPVSFRQGQVLGTWHVRVKVDSRILIDRDVLVFDARERRERERDAGR